MFCEIPWNFPNIGRKRISQQRTPFFYTHTHTHRGTERSEKVQSHSILSEKIIIALKVLKTSLYFEVGDGLVRGKAGARGQIQIQMKLKLNMKPKKEFLVLLSLEEIKI